MSRVSNLSASFPDDLPARKIGVFIFFSYERTVFCPCNWLFYFILLSLKFVLSWKIHALQDEIDIYLSWWLGRDIMIWFNNNEIVEFDKILSYLLFDTCRMRLAQSFSQTIYITNISTFG